MNDFLFSDFKEKYLFLRMDQKEHIITNYSIKIRISTLILNNLDSCSPKPHPHKICSRSVDRFGSLKSKKVHDDNNNCYNDNGYSMIARVTLTT